MSYGKLNLEQEKIVETYVKNQTVYDLGAGDCVLSEKILALGAKKVVAVDKENFPCDKKIQKITSTFLKVFSLVKSIETSFISWPQHYAMDGLIELIRISDEIIYLGSNTDGNFCGNPDIFEEFRFRPVISYSPSKANTLIVYGKRGNKKRKITELYGEEFAGLTINIQLKPLFFDIVENFFNDTYIPEA